MEKSTCVETRLDHLERKCREQGVPLTNQRRVIFTELAGRMDHPTADQIYDSLKEKDADLSRTTVYRTLETLGNLGLLLRVPTPMACARFDADMGEHDHFFCSVCEQLYDLPRSSSAERLGSLPDGFLPQSSSLTITGCCKTCQGQA